MIGAMMIDHERITEEPPHVVATYQMADGTFIGRCNCGWEGDDRFSADWAAWDCTEHEREVAKEVAGFNC